MSRRASCGFGPIVLLTLIAGTAVAHRDFTRGRKRHAATFSLNRALPDPKLTPGALDPGVTQADIHRTICVRGYTRTIRPDEEYTERLKREQIREYGYTDHRLRDYEEDHLVPLELGGSPVSALNLWPQPRHVAGGWGSRAKDRLESRLHRLVCRGGLALSEARTAIAIDWIRAYRRYMGPLPGGRWARRHRH